MAVMSLLLLAMIMTKIPLVVRIYDAVGVPLEALERAHVTVDQTMNGVGIQPGFGVRVTPTGAWILRSGTKSSFES